MIPGLPFEPPPGTPGGSGYIIPGMPGSPEYIPPGMPGSLEYHPSRRSMDEIPGPGGSRKRSRWALLVLLAFAILFVGAVVWIVVAIFNVIGAQ